MKSRNRGEAAKLEMTPMIDVVFQLLIFFIVTLKQRDILSYLNISRPAPQTDTTIKPIEMLTIQIGKDGWVLNGRPITGRAQLATLDRQLTHLASFSRDVSVIIKCTDDSPHALLIQTLNICTREGMSNLSVFSL